MFISSFRQENYEYCSITRCWHTSKSTGKEESIFICLSKYMSTIEYYEEQLIVQISTPSNLTHQKWGEINLNGDFIDNVLTYQSEEKELLLNVNGCPIRFYNCKLIIKVIPGVHKP